MVVNELGGLLVRQELFFNKRANCKFRVMGLVEKSG